MILKVPTCFKDCSLMIRMALENFAISTAIIVASGLMMANRGACPAASDATVFIIIYIY